MARSFGGNVTPDQVRGRLLALDCYDREVIGWVATTTGISGEAIRDDLAPSAAPDLSWNPFPKGDG